MKTNLLIIGAGISGVSIAYNLAKKGFKGIHVVDQGYFTNGATGRCGAGVRQQWGTKMNCILAKKSMEFFAKAEEILEYDGNLEFKQEGYLMLATTKEEHDQFSQNVKLQNELGIPSKQLTKEEALKIVPHLNPDAFISATFCQTDGHLNPFKMTEAYYLAAKKLGVTFSFFEKVIDIITENKKIKQVITDKNVYDTSKVVNAAGGYSKEIGDMAGVEIPVYSENHEILATEPIEKIQGPMVMSFSKNIYCQQVPHGAFLMGRSHPNVEKGHSTESTWEFLDHMSKTVVDIMPIIGNLRVVRQWGGSYNMSPDRQPIISDTDQLEGFYMACGFSGHGFMFAPMTGLLLSEMILNEKTTIDMAPLKIDRFKNADQFHVEKSVV
ncbi:NAD(P)/FAD-dependent oxidoreductase [Peloplasma aerotolerans]|uniref:FAD-binding oxidoreductase n=1 Tax=Peloplasma aerotolerans TaxID=3044389 RepID=A0AAW6UAB6_9MOLU|nr:FAD-binding oxidoreductase [Mariniplasma sp. M4Ah]MDI6453372.1 FAD-binding oxidoreductase [Mariniplasma sp. M4Ah]